MRTIDRLMEYLGDKKITAYSFERICQVANGYLKKQQKGRGTVGSDILLRIHRNYAELNLVWLISGEGEMLLTENQSTDEKGNLQEGKSPYTTEEQIQILNERIELLESSLADKNKIIELLETGKH